MEELSKQVFEYLKAIHANSFSLNVLDRVHDERMSQCRDCDHYDRENMMCKVLKVDILPKTQNALESCPEGRWEANSEKLISSDLSTLTEIINPSSPETTSETPVE
jgi:hypothetical protein